MPTSINSILTIADTRYVKIVSGLFAYLFNRIDLNQYLEYLNATGDRSEGVRVKDIARMSGYILKNCKLYAYAVHYARANNLVKPKFSDYQVNEIDAKFLDRLNLKHLSNSYKAFTLKEFDNVIFEIATNMEMKAYTGRFISKKMKFLIDSYGQNRSDIESHLKEAAITALYKQYPRYESHLHFTNIAKASIHNVGHSFITFHTARTRQQLQRREDGSHESVHVDLAVIKELAYIPSSNNKTLESLNSLAKLESRMTKKVKKFILCLAGVHNSEFSEYLEEDNSVIIDNISYVKYVKKLQTHMDISDKQKQNLFTKLKPYL
jgi:hypothetical protein